MIFSYSPLLKDAIKLLLGRRSLDLQVNVVILLPASQGKCCRTHVYLYSLDCTAESYKNYFISSQGKQINLNSKSMQSLFSMRNR